MCALVCVSIFNELHIHNRAIWPCHSMLLCSVIHRIRPDLNHDTVPSYKYCIISNIIYLIHAAASPVLYCTWSVGQENVRGTSVYKAPARAFQTKTVQKKMAWIYLTGFRETFILVWLHIVTWSAEPGK